MNPTSENVWFYYVVTLLFALGCGLAFGFGFGESHTPPFAFLLELLIIPIGLIWMLADTVISLSRKRNPVTRIGVHLIGLTMNGLLFVFIVMSLKW